MTEFAAVLTGWLEYRARKRLFLPRPIDELRSGASLLVRYWNARGWSEEIEGLTDLRFTGLGD